MRTQLFPFQSTKTRPKRACFHQWVFSIIIFRCVSEQADGNTPGDTNTARWSSFTINQEEGEENFISGHTETDKESEVVLSHRWQIKSHREARSAQQRRERLWCSRFGPTSWQSSSASNTPRSSRFSDSEDARRRATNTRNSSLSPSIWTWSPAASCIQIKRTSELLHLNSQGGWRKLLHPGDSTSISWSQHKDRKSSPTRKPNRWSCDREDQAPADRPLRP